jgi:hypothetical protein
MILILLSGPSFKAGKHSIHDPADLDNVARMETSFYSRTGLLDADDLLHVRAAECWLALGNLNEATQEVDRLPAGAQSHPEVERVLASLDTAHRYVRAVIRDNQILPPGVSAFECR